MKRFASIILAVVLVLSAGVCAWADDGPMDGGDWYCRFTSDEKMDSNFQSNNIDKTVLGMQPGDTVVFHMELENQHESTTDWYMENKVVQSLEASQTVAEGGAYTYDLRYVGPDGVEDVLYTSDSVGGEGKTMEEKNLEAGKVGLNEATSALEDFFYLDTLASGEKGHITLRVALEGETQGNAYQDTRALLQMNFAVELSPEQPSSPDSTPNPDTPYTPVRTGDESNMLLWSGVMLVCGLGVLALAVYTLRRNRKYREEDEDE